MTQKIIETNYALASVYPDSDGNSICEVNHKLYGDLRDKILKHERRHKAADRHYTMDDVKNDFQSENSYFLESLRFATMNTECLIGFFPLMYSYFFKEFTWNTAALVPFGYFGLIYSAILTFFLAHFFKLGWWSVLWSVSSYIVIFALINLILLWITHRYVRKDKGFVYKEVKN